MLHIFPTSRMVRDFYTLQVKDDFLPYAISMGEFESKVVLVPNLKLVPQDIRVLILQEACKFDNFKKLKIPNEFLSFLTNSSYIFRFFEELALEKKTCNDLKNADVYAEYNEHLEILEFILTRYTTLLRQKGYYDTITLPSLYKLNVDYLKRFDNIELHIEGFLNAYEWDLFKEISLHLHVKIFLHVNKYNQKMRNLFVDFGIKLPKEGYFAINLNEKSYESLNQIEQSPDITCKSFSLRSLQISYVFEQISKFIDEGIDPEDIAVVLPDESLALLLKAYDKANNLNFAMGFSYSKTLSYQKLSAINEAIKEDNPKNRNSLQRYGLEEKIISFKNLWTSHIEYKQFEELVCGLDLELDTKAQKLFQNELYNIKIILSLVSLNLSQIFKLFLQRLAKITLDDVGGGKIVVMGVLETRGARYKGLIIPDFNDEFVPRFVSKDMFISSQVRYHAGLPSLSDRENLQRYYYSRLIENAQKVAISYMEDESSIKSRFLQDFTVKADKRYDEKSYASLLFSPKKGRKSIYKKI